MADDAEAVVRAFCDAVAEGDVAGLGRFFADDVVYHNMPMDPVRGVDDTVAFLQGFLAMCESARFEIRALAVDGGTVLTERVDVFVVHGEHRPLPVMGAFEVTDGRITAWRDYFDMDQATALFT